MSRGTLKLLAILLMAGNHIAQVFLTPNTVSYHLLLTLGYATAPLMYAFLSDGFIYTHDRKAYGIRLLIFALVSELPFYLAFGRTGNMSWTLLLSYLCLVFWERKKEWACIPLILLTGWTDWSFLAPVFTLMVYGAKGDKGREALVFLYGTFLFVLICAANGEPMLHAFGFFPAGILRILCYNGEKGNIPIRIRVSCPLKGDYPMFELTFRSKEYLHDRKTLKTLFPKMVWGYSHPTLLSCGNR